MDHVDNGPAGLKASADLARRAYLDALVASEIAHHQLSCAFCRHPSLTTQQQRRICEGLNAETERLRVAVRDVWERLGFIPANANLALPDEHHIDRHCRRPR